MAVLSADYAQELSTATQWSFPVGVSAPIIYQGSMVMCIQGTGDAIKGADTASGIFLGIALENVDNSSGARAAKYVKVQRKGTARFASGSTTATRAAFVGYKVYIYDDNHVDLTGATTNHVLVGTCIDIDSQGYLIIDLLTTGA